jgi:uncharacterized membrane protein
MQWYYAIDGQQYGPVDEATIAALVREGKLRLDDLVWNETMGDQWRRASSVPEWFPEGAVSLTAGSSGNTWNADLMAQARACLAGRWGLAIGVVIVYAVIVMACELVPVVGGFVALLLGGPFELGLCLFFLTVARSEEARFSQLFEGFKQFVTAFAAYVLRGLLVLAAALPAVVAAVGFFAGMVCKGVGDFKGACHTPLAAVGMLILMPLLIIPVAVVSLGLSMVFFVIADRPAIGPWRANVTSWEVMKGRKWKYFCLNLRFIGWALLCVLTCGIGFLWLMPYMTTSFARFYDDIRPAA